MPDPAEPPRKHRPASGRILTWWFGAMTVVGALFGTIAKDRPFGNDVLEHPLVVMFVVVGAGLLVLRFVLRRPVPKFIPDRILLLGCFVGLVAFLLGNWFAVQLRAM